MQINKSKSTKSFQKSTPLVPIIGSTTLAANGVQFELELCWCVQQLENYLKVGKLSRKNAEDCIKNIKILKSSSVSLIKKRQTMKALLGDYRLKMREEEVKLALASKNIRFTPSVEVSEKSSFLKKSTILKSGKDFRFNLAPKNCSFHGSESEKNNEPDHTAKANYFCNIKDKQHHTSEFRFNFVIDTVNDIDFNSLSINQ